MSKLTTCPCHSTRPYDLCCGPYHQGKAAPTAEALMRSRFSAYAMDNADYLIETTHPNNPRYQIDFKQWAEEIHQFAQATQYEGLEILNSSGGKQEAFVTFKAHLTQNGEDISFTEKSRFLKNDGRWLYIDGEINR